MLEPPDITTAVLLERVRDAYGLPVEQATFLPVGNDSAAWAYRLDGDDSSWFLKVLGRRVDPGTIAAPRFLANHGVQHLLPPVSTVAGGPADDGNPFTLVVFPFFDGRPGGEVGLSQEMRTELGRLLRKIHDTPADAALAAQMRRERFHVRDASYLDAALAEMARVDADEDVGRAFASVWRHHQRAIEHALCRARALATEAASSSPRSVICHADFHAWNVLIAPDGEYVVIDWDETLLAPRERDLMFVSGNVADLDPDGTDFSAGYGPVDADRTLLAYYRYDWVLQEVADCHRRVFDRTLGHRTRTDAVRAFEELFGPDDVVQAAHDADERIEAG